MSDLWNAWWKGFQLDGICPFYYLDSSDLEKSQRQNLSKARTVIRHMLDVAATSEKEIIKMNADERLRLFQPIYCALCESIYGYMDVLQ